MIVSLRTMATLDGYGCGRANKNIFQQFFWFFIYFILIVITIFIIITLWHIFSNNPSVTSLISSTFPVTDVPFPGVAICSINQISKNRARIVANKIAEKTSGNPEKLMKYMHYVGNLIDFEFEQNTLPELLDFQSILDTMGVSVENLTNQLSTSCDDLLMDCMWQNVPENCSKLFTMKLTDKGHCCVLNSMQDTDGLSSTLLKTEAGVHNGLYISIKSDVEEYFYTSISSFGAIIQIFIPNDYPDVLGGGLNELMVKPNTENFIEIIPTTFKTTPAVAQYPIEKRECLFKHERSTSLKKIYSASDCVVDCRLASIQAMCDCIPFFIPIMEKNVDVCTINDIPCLYQFRDKWRSLYPEQEYERFFSREKQNSMRCNQRCYRSCTETVYEVSSNPFPINKKPYVFNNISHVYIYYQHRFSELYLHDAVYYWFEILSSFGGTFALLVGWSLISLLQLFIYYFQDLTRKLC